MSRLAVALIQMRTPATQAAALAMAEPLIRQAAADGAQLVLTPEGTNLLQRNRDAMFAALRPTEEDVCVQGLVALAAELKIWLLIGSALVLRPDGLAANRSLMISPEGKILASYDKIHMFDVDLPTGESLRESHSYESGSRAVLAETGIGPVGLTICYDMRFPHLYRALAQAGAKIFTIPSAFTVPTGEAHWSVLLRARAIETGAYIVAAAQAGQHQNGRATYGHSMVIDPWGRIIVELGGDGPGIALADIDRAAVTEARAKVPALDNARPFSLSVNTSGAA